MALNVLDSAVLIRADSGQKLRSAATRDVYAKGSCYEPHRDATVSSHASNGADHSILITVSSVVKSLKSSAEVPA